MLHYEILITTLQNSEYGLQTKQILLLGATSALNQILSGNLLPQIMCVDIFMTYKI